MTAEQVVAAKPEVTKEVSFLLRRLHSLTGIVPLGAFLLMHFFENASARISPEAFNETVLKISQLPYIYFIEIFLLGLPIGFHALYGLVIRTASRPDLAHNSYFRNWCYTLQRFTGIIILFYICFHVYTTRIWALFDKGAPITWMDMHNYVSNPIVALIYISGIAATTFHFSNGLWSFAITWGLVTSKAGQKRLEQVTIVLFGILCVVGIDIFSAFALESSILQQISGMIFG